MLARVVSVCIGYVFGWFCTGYLVGKKNHVDLRTVGSGNTGSTNTLRNLGVKAGLITLLGDVLKTILPMLLVYWFATSHNMENAKLLELYAGVGAVLGHDFPLPMKFKGGKGIASTAAIILIYTTIEVPVCLLVFVGIVAITRYVSLGSILVMICFFLQTLLFGQLGFFPLEGAALLEMYVVVAGLSILGIWKHRSNISRLLRGTENKISFTKNGNKE